MPTQSPRFFFYPTVIALSALSLVTGCGTGQMSPASLSSARAEAAPRDQDGVPAGAAAQAYPAQAAPAAPPPPPPPGTGGGQLAKASKDEDKTARPAAEMRDLVIYTATLTMAVYEVDRSLGAVEKIANDNGGYLGQRHDRAITIRVPRARFTQTLGALGGVGDVLHREIAAQDVTDEHVDLEIRIKNSRAMQRRLTELLAKATVKEAIDIEKELHRVTEELELLEGKMKLLADKIAFSTITVSFEPKSATVPVAQRKLPFDWLGSLNLPSLLSLSESK